MVICCGIHSAEVQPTVTMNDICVEVACVRPYDLCRDYHCDVSMA